LVSLLVDAHSEIILPLLPLFLTSVLGVNRTFVGLIEGIADSSSSILKVISGFVSDKLKKRKWIIFSGYAVSTLLKPFLYLARTGTDVLLVRFGDRVGKGIRSAPRDALIADSSPEEEKGKAFGFHRMMDTTGAVIGAALASVLIVLFKGNYRGVFLAAAIPGFIALFVFAVFVKEARPKAQVTARPLAALGPLPKELKYFLVVSAIFSLGNFSYAFFILGAQDLKISAAVIPIIYLFYNVVYAAAAQPAGALSDKIGRKPFLIFGYALFAICSFAFARANSQLWAWVIFGIYGIHSGVVEAVSRAYVSDAAPPAQRASALGGYHMIVGLMLLPASFIGGYLWDHFGRAACFYYAASLSSISCAALALPVKKFLK